MGDRSNTRLLFGEFEFDTESRSLFRDGWPVKVQPQPLRLLNALLQRPGETVSREVLRAEVWGDSTFVEFDQGLNYSIRQIRLALRDGAVNPTYIETLPKQGYRFIAEVRQAVRSANDVGRTFSRSNHQDAPIPSLSLPSRKIPIWLTTVAVAIGLTSLSGLVYLTRFRHTPSPPTRYTQLTDFTDSAMAPTLSPDGRMVAFFRSDTSFFTSDQIYLKLLPNGAVKRLTDDNRIKYSLAFSPDGSQIAYTAIASDSFSTYTVSVLGGESHLLLKNAAGLSWLDQNQLLFSEIKSGLHMGIVTATATRQHSRDIYFPHHERGMAHYSYPSPDRKKALVVEMNERGDWTNCRLISLEGDFLSRTVGPDGGCMSAAWSPDGSGMYFVAAVDGQSHLWHARYPSGQPEQMTFGPTEENGVAPERSGRSVITSMGVHESTIWMHDSTNERALISEGEISSIRSAAPSFSADGKQLYYLLKHRSEESEPELWRTDLASGLNEAVFPGLHMQYYAVSPDDQRVLYTTVVGSSKLQLWIAPIDKSSPARHIGQPDDRAPYFGPDGEILFEFTEGTSNYLGRMNQDGSGRSKVVPYPVSSIFGISPGRRWIMAIVPVEPGHSRAPVAIPTGGGPLRRVCVSDCTPSWSLDGKRLFVSIEFPSRTSPGRSLVIPVGPGEDLSALPPEGIKPMAQASDVPGSRSIDRADLIPGADLSHFAYVKTTAHYNLFRVQLP